jgi:hypothetical protein
MGRETVTPPFTHPSRTPPDGEALLRFPETREIRVHRGASR